MNSSESELGQGELPESRRQSYQALKAAVEVAHARAKKAGAAVDQPTFEGRKGNIAELMIAGMDLTEKEEDLKVLIKTMVRTGEWTQADAASHRTWERQFDTD